MTPPLGLRELRTLGSGAAYTRLLRVGVGSIRFTRLLLSSMAPPLGSGAAYTVTRLLRVEGMVCCHGLPQLPTPEEEP